MSGGIYIKCICLFDFFQALIQRYSPYIEWAAADNGCKFALNLATYHCCSPYSDDIIKIEKFLLWKLCQEEYI